MIDEARARARAANYGRGRFTALVMRATATGDAQTVSDLRDLLDLSDLD